MTQMNQNVQINLLKVKVESLEREIKYLKEIMKKYESIATCEFNLDGYSLKFIPTIVELIKRSEEHK